MRFEQVLATILLSLLAGTVGAFLILMGHLPDAKTAKPVESALAQVVKSGTLQCGYVLQAPYFIKDENTQAFSGLWYELTEKLAAINHLKVIWVTATTEANVVTDLKAKKFDLLCSGWAMGAQAQDLIVSAPVFHQALAVYVRADDQKLFSKPESLNRPDLKCALRSGTAAERWQQADFPAVSVVAAAHDVPESELLEQLMANKADFVIADRAAVETILKANAVKVREVVSAHVPYAEGRGFAMLPEETPLRDFMSGRVQDLIATDFVNKTLAKYAVTPGSWFLSAPLYDTGVERK